MVVMRKQVIGRQPWMGATYCSMACLALALAGAWCGGCKKRNPAADDPRAAEVKARDKECEADLKGNAHEEARTWCAPEANSNMGFKMSRNEMLTIANDLYAAGAVRVEVVGIEAFGERKIAAQFAVVLPGSPDSRTAVFALLAKFEEDERPPPDLGQSCALLSLD
jgi:hypothetical protein